MARIIAYTYYSGPWKLESGDDLRIHRVLAAFAKSCSNIITFNLSPHVGRYTVTQCDYVTYVSLPRKSYGVMSRIIRWKSHYDLNPLMKITHYIDELLIMIKLREELAKARVMLVFGSMTLFSFMARVLGLRSVVIYDALANYAQTLYVKSRKSLAWLLRYGLFLALHKLQLQSSNIVVYPSKMDMINAKRMFELTRTFLIPNPSPICYGNLEEYISLRDKRTDYSRPYFLLLAGGKGRGNEEAVKLSIKIFNRFPPEKFKLIITGPWLGIKSLVKNSSIEILGTVPHERLKEILAIADYGLAPIFSHSSGTFLKTLAYIAAGLDIVASPYAIMGIDLPRGIKTYIVRNTEEYRNVISHLVNEVSYKAKTAKERCIALCEARRRNQEIETLCREVLLFNSKGRKADLSHDNHINDLQD
jgi:glycosyltransferase involved in cell wall biosynthesis